VNVQTIEVDVIDGRVEPVGAFQLPKHARGVLTLFTDTPATQPTEPLIGLKKFLELPAIPSTPEQVRASLEEDFYDQ
jgi:hypothetical protein